MDNLKRNKTEMLSRLKQIFSFDLRSLALFRIGLGLLLLSDTYIRLQDLTAAYSDAGFLPRWALTEKFMAPWNFSIHLLNGRSSYEALLFAFAVVLAVMVGVGYRTWLATFLSWFLLVSVQNRNPAILHGGDNLLRLLLFWGLFLPLGARYSIDAALDDSVPDSEKPSTIFSGGTIAYLCQIVFVYLFAALLKSGAEWRSEHSALYYALSIDQFATRLGSFYLQFPGLLKLLTVFTFWFEATAWWLFLTPFLLGPLRTLGVLLFIVLHIGFGSGLELGSFPWVSAVSVLALLPPWFWERVSPRIYASGAAAIRIFYDGDCGFCKKMVLILKTFLLPQAVKINPAQEDPRTYAEMLREKSWMVQDAAGSTRFRFDGIVVLVQASPFRGLSFLFHWNPVRWIGDRTYQFVASHRKEAGDLTKFLKSRPLRLQLPELGNAAAIIFTWYVFWWNVGTVHNRLQMPPSYEAVAQILRLDQFWNMFAPYPMKEDGWYVVPAKLRDGTIVDLFKDGAPVSWEKPARVSATYKNERWRKYWMNLWLKSYSDYRIYMGRYYCRGWNDSHSGEKTLEALQIIFMLEKTPPEGQPAAPVEKVLLWDQHCSPRPGEEVASAVR